ncbi:MAG: DNA mismatch repair endonuclease MutL [Bdellovibrionales bacterium]|nr:DNA mismatch repair endonuclease MutL [Bdellovibrionales bacterium]
MSAPPNIRVLPDGLVNKIAAGEVVERPASVVKELVENSLDAGATHIRISIREGGVGLLEVADDGHGIHPDDLALSLDRHATSKIRSSDDLFAIRTWGFRGEALASIASVSRVRLSSRHRDEPMGREISVEGTTARGERETARPVGTTVAVQDLFFNTPARKKFLKSQAAETAWCGQVVQRLALAAPQATFELLVDGERTLHLPACENPADRVVQVFRDALRIPVEREELIQFRNVKPDAAVEGWLLPARFHIPSSRGIFTYVNQRHVKDRMLQQAITTAAKEVLFGNLYPQLVLHVRTAAENVDVNVHPTKSEVRFRNQGQLFGLIRATLERALAGDRPLPERSDDLTREQVTELLFTTRGPTHFHQKAAPIEHSPSVQPAPSVERAAGPQFLGTLRNTYLVCQTDEGLLLVDQHAAHERVTYERLKRSSLGEGHRLLIPIVVELPCASIDLLEPHLPRLEPLGLELDRTGPDLITVRTLPALLTNARGAPRVPLHSLVKSLSAHLEEEKPEEALPDLVKDVILETLASQSCHGSVRAGQSLSAPEAEALLAQMSETDYSGHCPHGRPTTVRLSWPEIERLFKRLV